MSHKLITFVCLAFMLGLTGNALAQIDPATVETGHVYLFNSASNGQLSDASANSNSGSIVGDPQVVSGLIDKALLFDGVDDFVRIPNSSNINSGGPFTNRTIMAVFNCDDVNKEGKQTIFEEGGATRGLVMYVFEGQVYVGGWNRAEYTWDGAWLSAPIASNEWHAVALVLRDGTEAVEEGKFEMWMDGELVTSAPGGQLFQHTDGIGIGATSVNTVFHDEDSTGSERDFFGGAIDEIWILNDALSEAELNLLGTRPWPGSIHRTTWANLSWAQQSLAASYDLYFSNSLDDVVAGAADAFMANKTKAKAGAGGLVPGTTYYWRVDSVDVNGIASEGNVWSFSLLGLMATEPSPAEGSVFRLTDTILRWTASINALGHRVFFGESLTDVAVGSIDVYKGTMLEPSYDPAGLKKSATYYWRVDELEADGTTVHIGDVWSFSTIPDVPMSDPNLVAWWKLDGEYLDLGYVLDYSGYDHHGTPRGDTHLVNGYESGALAFDGDGDYVNIDGWPGILGGHAISATAWIKTSNTGTGAILGWGPNTAGERFGFRHNASRLRFEHHGGNIQGDTNMADGEWHHVGVTIKENVTVSHPDVILWLDGVDDTRPTTDPDPIFNITAAGDARIGSRLASNDRFFDGLIDEVRIYDKALTAEEIAVDMRIDPLRAYDPSPADRATDLQPTIVLSWMPGDNAVQHNVYLGTDATAVAEAKESKDTDGIFKGTQDLGNESYSPVLGLETTYYWRIDEINADGSVTKGRTWSFTTDDNILIFDEETPVPYDNTAEPYISGAELEFDPPLDWSGGLGMLVLRYKGQRAAGSATLDEATNTYTVVGAGSDIWGTSDQFQYVYKMLNGDGALIVRVDNLVQTDDWTKAGIMIRESLDPSSAFAAIYATGANGVRFQARSVAGIDATSDTSVATDEQKALNPPVWLMMVRQFPMINAYYSSDGVTWTPMSWNPQVLPMAPNVYIGLAVTSHSGENVYAEATISNIYGSGGVDKGPFTSTEIGMSGANSPEPLYMVLEDAAGATAVVRNPDPSAAQKIDWTDWSIHIGRSDIDLTAVRSISIAIGNMDNPAPGGTGVITVGSLRLYPNVKPVALWKLDDGDGTTAVDSSSNGNDGTLNGDPQWVAGMLDGALEFDGVDDYVDCGNPTVLDFGTGDFTVSAWIQMTATERGTVYAKGGDNSGGIRYTLAMGEGNDNKMTLTTDDDASKKQAKGATIVNDGLWHHVVGMRYGNTSLVYVDGVLDGSLDLPEGYDLSGTSQHNALIGAITSHTDGSLEKFFNGTIDDVHIYDWALSDAEISLIAGL